MRDWRAAGPAAMPLPHPSWRNTAWLRRNPWFEAELVPELRLRVARLLAEVAGMSDTPIDLAHRAQAEDPEDAALRLRLYERVLDAELLLVLADAPEGRTSAPLTLDLAEGPFVLAFDRDDRLADFIGEPAPFAVLSGRQAVARWPGAGSGSPSTSGRPPRRCSTPRRSTGWREWRRTRRSRRRRGPAASTAPGVPAALLSALGPKLAAMADRLAGAHLVEAHYPDASAHLLLLLAGTPEPDRPGMAAAIAEAVRFSGPEGVALDVAFLEPGDPRHAAAERVGIRLDLPRPPPRPGPGMDPARPPRLV